MNKEREALEAVYKDLLMRASFNTFNNDGELIVEVGAGVWFKVCNALGKTSDERTREDIEKGRDLLTISLSEEEKEVLTNLAAKQELSLSRLLGQALSTYQLYDAGHLKSVEQPAVEPEYTKVEGDDWPLEQQAFYFANHRFLPDNAKAFIKELWKAYCLNSITPESGENELSNRLTWCAEASGGEEFMVRKASLTRHDIRQASRAVKQYVESGVVQQPIVVGPRYDNEVSATITCGNVSYSIGCTALHAITSNYRIDPQSDRVQTQYDFERALREITNKATELSVKKTLDNSTPV